MITFVAYVLAIVLCMFAFDALMVLAHQQIERVRRETTKNDDDYKYPRPLLEGENND
jgi:hypothetical protein